MFTTTATLTYKYDSPSGSTSYLLFQPIESFSFSEGQFVMIETHLHGKLTKKPYSIATTHRMLVEEKLVWVVVKKTSENGMSDYLTQKIQVGDTVTLKWPVGHYVDPETSKNYLLISTGSGLSPNVGVFHHLVYERQDHGKIVHLYGERYTDDLIPEIQTILTAQSNKHIQTICYLSREATPPHGYRAGHVQDGLVEAVDRVWTDATCFVCGSPAMVTDVVEKLQLLGIPNEQIITEKY